MNGLKTVLNYPLKTGKYILYVKIDKQSNQIYPDKAKL
jgi:hypothetical protein